MRKILTAGQTRELEDRAAKAGISHYELMERAGNAAARFLLARCGAAEKKTLVLCGNGNNGGDGFVLARVLAQAGGRVTVLLVKGEPRTRDAAAMLELLRREKAVRVAPAADAVRLCGDAELIVDAVYGIGFHGDIDPAVAEVLLAANRADAVRVAVDLPSGTECDGAKAAGVVFLADETLSFSAYKPVHWHAPADQACGRTTVLPIGIPDRLLAEQPETALLLDDDWVASALPRRPEESNKGTFGKALCVCGSYGMAGAAMLAASAALRCGAGLVQLALPRSIYPCVASSLAEPVMLPLCENAEGRVSPEALPVLLRALRSASSCLIGCGLGVDASTEEVVLTMLQNAEAPLVLDADGINIASKHMNILKTAKAPLVLTPHPGEMARMTGLSAAQVQARRADIAGEFAREYGVVLVLKGRHTVVAAPGGGQWVNPTGNSGMARGGSGDLLSGMLAAFLAQGMEPAAAASAAVYLHGLAGDRCAARRSKTAMQPHELLEELPELFLKFERQG